MRKIWSVILYITALLWFIDAIGLFFGYNPKTFSIFVSFVVTGCTVAKWGYDAWRGK